MKKQGIFNKTYLIQITAIAFLAMNPIQAYAQDAAPARTHDIPVEAHEVTVGVGFGLATSDAPGPSVPVEGRLEYAGPHGRLEVRGGVDASNGNGNRGGAGAFTEFHIPVCPAGTAGDAAGAICFTVGANGMLNWVNEGRTTAIGTLGVGGLAFLGREARLAFIAAAMVLYDNNPRGYPADFRTQLQNARGGGMVHMPIRVVGDNVRFELDLGVGLAHSIDPNAGINPIFMANMGIHWQPMTGAMVPNFSLLASCLGETGTATMAPDCRAMLNLSLAIDVSGSPSSSSESDAFREEERRAIALEDARRADRLAREEEDRRYEEARRDEVREEVRYDRSGYSDGYSDGN
jgi:hypothetical protein